MSYYYDDYINNELDESKLSSEIIYLVKDCKEIIIDTEKLKTFTDYQLCYLYNEVYMLSAMNSNQYIEHNLKEIYKFLVQKKLMRKCYLKVEVFTFDDIINIKAVSNKYFGFYDDIDNLNDLSDTQIITLWKYWKNMYIEDLTINSTIENNFKKLNSIVSKFQ